MAVASDVALDLTVPIQSSGVTVAVRGPAGLDGQRSTRIDHFVVERKIGAGGMGAIYAARDVALDRAVAIKVLPDELSEYLRAAAFLVEQVADDLRHLGHNV